MKTLPIKYIRYLATVALLSAAGTIWTGCDKRALDPVSVRMKWIINGTTSEFFYGRETKIFKSQGFDLEIQPGGPGISGVQLVATGASTFAVTSAEEVIRARVNNLPVIAVASVFQRNAVLFLRAESSGITSPAHFKNKTVALVTGDNSELQFNALLEGAGLKREDVKVIPWTFDLRQFSSGTIDLIPAYAFDQPLQLRRKFPAFKFVELDPAGFGVDATGDVLVVSEQLTKAKPELVRRFVQAFVDSLQAARDHQEAAVQALINANKGSLAFEEEVETWKKACEYIAVDPEKPGTLLPEKWRATKERMEKLDGLKVPSGFQVTSCYTNDYVELSRNRR